MGSRRRRSASPRSRTTPRSSLAIEGGGTGASPHNLLSDTLGDELKLATGGKARVFAVSLKDRAAVLPGGFSADGAYWIDPKSGAWITSTFYRPDLPEWVRNFNTGHRAEKFWNREWKDETGNVLGSTAPRNGQDGKPAGFYEVVGSTPFANDYQFEFAKELVLYEKLGTGPATDLLVISLSANDILGHQVGPDSPQMRGMALELDRQTRGVHRLSWTSGGDGERLDGALGGSWHCAAARVCARLFDCRRRISTAGPCASRSIPCSRRNTRRRPTTCRSGLSAGLVE